MGMILLDEETFESMMQTLASNAAIFDNYGELHKAKDTPEGTSKAVANWAHRDATQAVIDRVKPLPYREATPYRDAVELAMDCLLGQKKVPVKLVMTDMFARGLFREIQREEWMRLMFGAGPVPTFEAFLQGTYLGCSIRLSSYPAESGVLACAAESPAAWRWCTCHHD